MIVDYVLSLVYLVFNISFDYCFENIAQILINNDKIYCKYWWDRKGQIQKVVEKWKKKYQKD